MDISITRGGGFEVVSVAGRMDSVTAGTFEQRLCDLIQKGNKRLRVDFSGLEYISSAGLRAVLIVAKRVQAEKGEIAFSGLKGPVKDIFSNSGFYSVLEIIEPRSEAGRARLLSDKEYAECFNVFKSVSTEWTAILDWIEREFVPSASPDRSPDRSLDGSAEGPLDILSIGSGTGDFDLMFMKALRRKVSDISYVALDPNQEHNAVFNKRFRESGIDLRSFRIIAKPFRKGEVKGPFDVIHLTHCLYYIPNRKEAIRQTYDLLKPGGSLLVFHQTPIGINEIQREFMKRVKGSETEMFSTRDIQKLIDGLGIPCQFDILVSDLDVTDCIADNSRGKHLLNFLLESNLDRLEGDLRDEIVSMIKGICREEDGRHYLFHPSGIFWAKKPA